MQQLRGKGSSIWGKINLRKKAQNTLFALQDTFFSTKDIFERHRVVFTVSTSIASLATAWAGYTLRRHHESKVEKTLDSIEKAMANNYHIEYKEFKELVGSGSSRTAATIATAGTTMVIGYVLGWRGGIWYANRKFRREQMKLLGQIKPKRWQRWKQNFFRRPLVRPKLRESVAKSLGVLKKDASTAHNSLISGIADTKV